MIVAAHGPSSATTKILQGFGMLIQDTEGEYLLGRGPCSLGLRAPGKIRLRSFKYNQHR